MVRSVEGVCWWFAEKIQFSGKSREIRNTESIPLLKRSDLDGKEKENTQLTYKSKQIRTQHYVQHQRRVMDTPRTIGQVVAETVE